ncbi:MAG: hypothetical protein ACRDRR_16135 [Pseudonocardiaceae bacterium]
MTGTVAARRAQTADWYGGKSSFSWVSSQPPELDSRAVGPTSDSAAVEFGSRGAGPKDLERAEPTPTSWPEPTVGAIVMPIALLDRPAPIHDDATRRQFLIGGASLAAQLAAAVDGDPATMVGQR